MNQDERVYELEAQVEIIHDRQEELGAQVEALQAGADDTPVEEGVMPTAGQWIHIFLGKTGPGRLEMTEAMFKALEVGTRCVNYGHESLMEELKHTRERLGDLMQTCTCTDEWDRTSTDECPVHGAITAIAGLRQQLEEMANKAEVYRLDRDQKAGVLDELSKRARLVTHKKYNIVGHHDNNVAVWCEGCNTLLSETAALGPEQVIESILNHESEGCPANA